MQTVEALEQEHNHHAFPWTKSMELSWNEWKTARKSGIDSDEAAAAIGLNPYQSQLELWMTKTGRTELSPKKNLHGQANWLSWGMLVEPLVAARYAERTGNQVEKTNSILRHADIDKGWMLANIRHEVIGAGNMQILNCKTSNELEAKLWEEHVPIYVQCQMQHELAVTGKATADIALLIWGKELRIFHIERDETIIRILIELERRFWHYVETDTPPPAGSDSAAMVLQNLYSKDFGTTLEFSNSQKISAALADLALARAEATARAKLEVQDKQRMQQCMDQASRMVLETLRNRLDKKTTEVEEVR